MSTAESFTTSPESFERNGKLPGDRHAAGGTLARLHQNGSGGADSPVGAVGASSGGADSSTAGPGASSNGAARPLVPPPGVQVASARPASARLATVDHLDLLESHAIFIMREVAAESERPVLLFSGGKDSAVLLHLAIKAFRPGGLPFPVLHVDTGHNFAEVIEYRDKEIERLGERLLVASVQESIDRGRVADPGPGASRNRLQTVTLLDAISEHKFDACFGGARRDEDKARAKERVLSFRDAFGQWDPKRQRPELWQLYQGRVQPGEHLRAFPLSDWTELDIWQYVGREGIDLPSIYYAHQRPVIERDGMLLAESEWVGPGPGESVEEAWVRFRTVGDATCTGAVRSRAATVAEIIDEVAASRVSERGATRADDRFSETSMEDRKREGYF